MIFTAEHFSELGVCQAGIRRVVTFGGGIENTVEGWTKYKETYPGSGIGWKAAVWTAWRMNLAGWAISDSLVWDIARIALRECEDESVQALAPALGPNTWMEVSEKISTADVNRFIGYAVEGAAQAMFGDDDDDERFNRLLKANDAREVATDVYESVGWKEARIADEIFALAVNALVAAEKESRP